MDYRKTAEAILAGIGGESNITHLEHCSTRLRFTLADNRLVQVDALKKIPGVLGVVMTAQCQVIIGNQVVEVYNALSPMVHTANSPAPMPGNGQKRRAGDVLLDFIVGVFQPLVPAIAGGGILKSVLLLLSMIGLIAKDSTAYTIFNTLADAPFYFLPLLVADAAAVKLQCSRFLALSTVGSLLLPNMITLIGGETQLFGLPITNVNYAYQVFPALLCVLFLALVEKYVTKWSPKVIRIFFVPLLCFAIVVPVTLLALGPAGYWFGVAFTKGILFLFNKLGWIAVTVLAVALPFMIAIGMHKALLPYAVTSISELGKELLYLPASLAHNIAESGACFAAAIRAKGSEERSTAVSAGISALFGITEPALYGVTLQNKRILWSVMIGAGLGGAYVGLFSVEAFVAVGPGLASLSMFLSEIRTMNLVHAVIGAGIAFGAAFVSGCLLYRPMAVQAEAEQTAAAAVPAQTIVADSAPVTLSSPMSGTAIPLGAVPDEVFSGGVLGDGIALVPDSGELYAPADGVIVNIPESRHAISMATDGGLEILMHVGLDTVSLHGAPYHTQVREGDHVKAGQLLLTFDLDAIRSAGYDPVTPVILTNAAEDTYMENAQGSIRAGDTLITLRTGNHGETEETV